MLCDGALFYWHLGDYRAIYMVDEDYGRLNPQTSILDYQNNAKLDFGSPPGFLTSETTN